MNNFDSIVPNVIESRYFSSRTVSLEQSTRVVHNYELDFNIAGGRTVTVDGRVYVIEKNSIVFRRPGEIAKSEGVYDMYILTFNFDKETIKNYNRNDPSYKSKNSSDIAFLCQFPTYIKPYHSAEIIEIYRYLLSNFGAQGRESICSQLVVKLLYLLASDMINLKSLNSSEHSKKIDEAISFIFEHYAEPITLEMIANHVYLDKSYLSRCFKKATGKSPIDFLFEKRISSAKMLLEDTDLGISEIASLCGFSDASYFTLRFRSSVGRTPTNYRKNRAT